MRRTLVSLAALVLFAAPLQAGPPWIAIEYPANPHHADTRGAALLVRAYHHGDALDAPVRGSAEGIVDGRRLSRPLDLRATATRGVFALRTPLPREGRWVLVITAEQGKDATATALVKLDGAGGIANVEVPATQSRDGWTVPRSVERADIERALRAAVASEAQRSPRLPLHAGWLGLPLLALFAWRRNGRR